MRFPPIKAGRALLWITLRPDDTANVRYAALRAILRTCRLHPVDTTPGAEIVIVEEAAFRARLDEIREALGAADILHLVSAAGERLLIDRIVSLAVRADPVANHPPEHRPPWLLD